MSIEKEKPYGYVRKEGNGFFVYGEHQFENITNAELVPIYLHPPKREWQGLTDEEIMEMLDYGQYGRVPQYARNFVEAIEAKLKEKNT